jgi:Tol biopolymer transport system component
MREPLIEGADEADQPTWNIWEYDTVSRQLRRVIESDIVAEEGHDLAPHYLPDGRIVFASTRQRQSRAILLDEGKPQFAAQDEDRREPAFVLHVMNADGTGLRQISFNQSHDLDPSVLDDGRIVFSRWENAGRNNEMNLYAVRPDGTQLELLYGAQSHATGSDQSDVHFLEPRPAANGRLLARAQPFQPSDRGGQLLEIDVANYVENDQPTLPNRGYWPVRRSCPQRSTTTTLEGRRPADATARRSRCGRHGTPARELDTVPVARG